MIRAASHAALLAAALLFVAQAALAVGNPADMLPDPAQERRAREIGRELRCLVCQNESIEDSNADLARDLRRLVRERIRAGDSDSEVIAFIRDRYGDFVLLRPPFTAATAALWLSPALALAGGVLAIWLVRRRGKAAPAAPAPLSPEEQARLAALEAEARQ
jgi:cytochrome c-type biogenesis protein CcmH